MVRRTRLSVKFPIPARPPLAWGWRLLPVASAAACVAVQLGSVLPGPLVPLGPLWCNARAVATMFLMLLAPWPLLICLGGPALVWAAKLLHLPRLSLRQAYLCLLGCVLLSGIAVWLADEPTARLAAHYAAPALTETRLALGAYRRDHGDWPRDLDALVPTYLPVVRAPGLPCCPEMRYYRGVVWVTLPSGVFRHVLTAGAFNLRGACCDFTEMSGVWYGRLWIQYGGMPPLRPAPGARQS